MKKIAYSFAFFLFATVLFTQNVNAQSIVANTNTNMTTVEPVFQPAIVQITLNRLIKLGTAGLDVSKIQQFLSDKGYLKNKIQNNLFDQQTKNAVKSFQADHDLKPDGLVGPVTVNILNQEAGTTLCPVGGTSFVKIQSPVQEATFGLGQKINFKWISCNTKSDAVEYVIKRDGKQVWKGLTINDGNEQITIPLNVPLAKYEITAYLRKSDNTTGYISSVVNINIAKLPICSDGIDNDHDGFTDFPADKGCTWSGDKSELEVIITQPTISKIPRIGYWWGKVNQHIDANGYWQTDLDGVSGADLDPLTYCKKFYQNIVSVKPGNVEFIKNWHDRGNVSSYDGNAQNIYECVQKTEENDKSVIKVISPNGGETFKSGQQITVSWESHTKGPNHSPVTIILKSTQSQYKSEIITVPNTGNAKITLPKALYNDTVPLVFGNYYKIVVQLGYSQPGSVALSDESDNFFTIN